MMRRRLSYANVMATLAFFFALTGVAIAGPKYLQATDPITNGDLAGSTYGSPVIADGAITSSKFNGAAVAPDSSKLAGHGIGDFPIVVARLNVDLSSGPLAPGTCAGTAAQVAGVDPATDIGVVQAKNGQGYVNLQVQILQGQIGLGACNVGTTTTPVDGTYPVLILR